MGQDNAPRWALGLMSGTSLDGVDAALLQTDGESIMAFGPSLTLPYDEAIKHRIRALATDERDVPAVEMALTRTHADAVQALLQKAGMRAEEVSIIGFHGQTIRHKPEAGITWQIGNGAWLAQTTGIDVICDFRRADVAAGGQGAPLVPVYHLGLARESEAPLVLVNIGGIANLTYIPADHRAEGLIAFDTGPGNCLIDRWVAQHTGAACDMDGVLGLAGVVHEDRLTRLMAHPFIQQPPAKSCHTDDFTLEAVEGLSLQDGAATLAAFTARSIGAQAQFLPQDPLAWVVCGGGAHNGAIMQALRGRLQSVHKAGEHGWSVDAMEAQAFAYLAVRSQRGLPLTYPNTTGVSRAATGGAFYRAARGATG